MKTRINRGIAHEVQSSGHLEGADMTAVAYHEKLLACEEVHSQEQIIVQGMDEPFVDYLWSLARPAEAQSGFNCKTFTLPPKPSSTLRNLTTHKLPEDVIGLIGSFNHDVHCPCCELFSFNMTFSAKCRAALNTNQWRRVQREVEQEGGSCNPSGRASETWQTLQTCMTSSKANQVAMCHMGFPNENLEVSWKEEQIKETEDIIKEKQEKLKGLKDDLEMRKQNSVYLKQIFEGP